MASESSSERSLSVTLPSDLDDWLDEQSTALDIDREQLLIQLLSSYRTTAELDGDAEQLPLADEAVADAVETALAERLSTELDEQLGVNSEQELQQRIRGEVQSAVEAALTEQLSEATNSVQRQLSNRIDSVESEFDEKITDVRERVIQLKKEIDKKAPADHSHEELAEVEALATQLEEMEADLSELQTEFEESVPEHEETLDDVDDRLEQLQDRMQTVAWVVSDLRDAYESKGGLEAVERIKRAAAKADIERAECENCGDSVVLSLLTDPECPHCNATVSNVEPASGWFRSPKLLTASQLESGEQR